MVFSVLFVNQNQNTNTNLKLDSQGISDKNKNYCQDYSKKLLFYLGTYLKKRAVLYMLNYKFTKLAIFALLLSSVFMGSTYGSTPPKQDYVTIENHGAYILDVTYLTYVKEGVPISSTVSVWTPNSVDIKTLHNSIIKLHAEAGKSTALMSKPYSKIDCFGTTLIGFACQIRTTKASIQQTILKMLCLF